MKINFSDGSYCSIELEALEGSENDRRVLRKLYLKLIDIPARDRTSALWNAVNRLDDPDNRIAIDDVIRWIDEQKDNIEPKYRDSDGVPVFDGKDWGKVLILDELKKELI